MLRSPVAVSFLSFSTGLVRTGSSADVTARCVGRDYRLPFRRDNMISISHAGVEGARNNQLTMELAVRAAKQTDNLRHPAVR